MSTVLNHTAVEYHIMREEGKEKTTHDPGLTPEGKTSTYQNLSPWATSTPPKGLDHMFGDFRKARSPCAKELSLELGHEARLH